MPPDRKARVAGLLYVISIVSGFCAEAFVRNRLVVCDDAVFTARSIIASPSLYRPGFLADLISFTTGILVSIIFYDLFKSVSRPAARTALAFAVVSNEAEVEGNSYRH